MSVQSCSSRELGKSAQGGTNVGGNLECILPSRQILRSFCRQAPPARPQRGGSRLVVSNDSRGLSFPSIGINDCGTTSESSWTQYVQGYDGNRVLGEIDQKMRSDFDRFLL